MDAFDRERQLMRIEAEMKTIAYRLSKNQESLTRHRETIKELEKDTKFFLDVINTDKRRQYELEMQKRELEK